MNRTLTDQQRSEACATCGVVKVDSVSPPRPDVFTDEELRLYKEAVAVGSVVPKAGCALLRVLFEKYLTRQITLRWGCAPGWSPTMPEWIGMACKNFGLGSGMRTRLRCFEVAPANGVHDPYGLTGNLGFYELTGMFDAFDHLTRHVELVAGDGTAESMERSNHDHRN